MFTDIVSSTALKQHLGDKAGAALIQEQRALVRQLLATCPGAEEIETAGDSFLLSFLKPSDAVRFALVLQGRLRSLNQGQAIPLEERIGIHLGEVVIEQHEAGPKPKDLYGIQLDACARVMSLAKGGQVLMSRGVFDNARQVLKGEDLCPDKSLFHIRVDGSRSLKGRGSFLDRPSSHFLIQNGKKRNQVEEAVRASDHPVEGGFFDPVFFHEVSSFLP